MTGTTSTNWLSDSVHHCEWYGISCDSEARVVLQIELIENNLQGAIPPEIGNLTGLKVLRLDINNLSSLPSKIGNLINLEELSLGHNNLSSLPPEIGSLVNLQVLGLGDNNLTPTLPPQIGSLVNLQEMRLGDNDLDFTAVRDWQSHQPAGLVAGWQQPECTAA